MKNDVLIRWLVPVAALSASPLAATTYLTLEQAQTQLFPGQSLSALAIELSGEEAKTIEKASHTRVRERALKVWKAEKGGYFYLDQVIGKHELITYAVAISEEGQVTGLEILDYRETYGGEVREPKWRQQFVGKSLGAPLELEVDIANISGATLSSRNITLGVRRLLTTHALVLKKG